MGSFFSSSSDSCYGSCSVENKMNSLIFRPPITPENHFDLLNTHRSILFNIQTPNGNINCVLVVPIYRTLHNLNNIKQYIIFSHGNAEDIFNAFDYLKYLADKLDVVVISYDYPGYGLSNGSPNETNCYDSITFVVSYVKNNLNISDKQILLIGQSLGTGIVVDYVANTKWKSPIILISPYKSIARVILDTSCVRPIDKFETHRKLNDVQCPVKIFHGEKDALINISHGKMIYNGLTDKTFQPTWIPDTGHNDILSKINLDELRNILNYMQN